ncbi:MAG: hypothetical protein A2Z83_06165 [Omnitrophica bacterium GWA2_52_8]|nr:MAG: hypothetical protein A2Z83_06165 [Omnitrophica bacterium GWA2_52_8]
MIHAKPLITARINVEFAGLGFIRTTANIKTALLIARAIFHMLQRALAGRQLIAISLGAHVRAVGAIGFLVVPIYEAANGIGRARVKDVITETALLFLRAVRGIRVRLIVSDATLVSRAVLVLTQGVAPL